MAEYSALNGTSLTHSDLRLAQGQLRKREYKDVKSHTLNGDKETVIFLTQEGSCNFECTVVQ